MLFSFTCSYNLEYYASRGASDASLVNASCESKIVLKVSDPSKSSSTCNAKTTFNHTAQNLNQTNTACLPLLLILRAYCSINQFYKKVVKIPNNTLEKK